MGVATSPKVVGGVIVIELPVLAKTRGRFSAVKSRTGADIGLVTMYESLQREPTGALMLLVFGRDSVREEKRRLKDVVTKGMLKVRKKFGVGSGRRG